MHVGKHEPDDADWLLLLGEISSALIPLLLIAAVPLAALMVALALYG